MKTIVHRPHFENESILWEQGYTVIGLDEVGRGAFAGPLVVSAVVFDKVKRCSQYLQEHIDDSKRLSAIKRVELAKYIQEEALHIEIASVPVSVINRKGIGKSNLIAFRKAVQNISKKIQQNNIFLLVDGFSVPHLRKLGLKNQRAIIKGDQISLSIAAASIIAKVYRDSLMEQIHQNYLVYNFASNKGYGTLFHRTMIKQYGLTKFHRKAFCH